MKETAMPHKALASGNGAVVTGAASGIGLAAAHRLAKLGLNVVLCDKAGEALERAGRAVAETAGAKARVQAIAADVSRFEDMLALRDKAQAFLGAVSVLMNNAGISGSRAKPWTDLEGWRALMDVNLWGVIHGVQAFAPAMLEKGAPSLIINTGSKQGITLPPGNSPYNVSKAGVKAYTELLAHELRNTAGGAVSAHLLIPGFTFTGITGMAEKPAGAFTPDQVVDLLLAGLERGDFYILCPDNEVDRATDERRMLWAMGDIVENRPALSRWHPDHGQAFAAYMRREPR
jgi:NAD(P)-dependent dehydrogenase (short-subunit alcohol dehydrogenase family)